MKRKMSVEGAFYPNDSKELNSSFNYFNEIIEQHFKNKLYDEEVKALIVPHAGYVYSGFTANLAYRNIKQMPKRVVVIGPSHRIAFDGVSMSEYENYKTPLGNIEADIDYMRFLKSQFDFTCIDHQEHSTEVQFPFIKHYFLNTKLVELIYSHNSHLEEIIEIILNDRDNLLIISTDLSHFYTQEKANVLDNQCIKGIENLDIQTLQSGEACGMPGVVALLHVAKKNALHVKSLDYRTSGDITGEAKSVVGYYSAIIY